MILKGLDLKGLHTPNNAHSHVESMDISTKGEAVFVVNPRAIATTPVEYFTLAGNATRTFYVPRGVGYRVRVGQLTLTTDATVANRYIYFECLDRNANVIGRPYVSQAVTASSSTYIFLCGEACNTQDSKSCGCPVVLDGNRYEAFYLRVNNGVAGDTFSGYLSFEEYTLSE